METSSTNAHQKSTSNTSEESVLVEKSLDFSSPWHFSDVVLVVEDTKFHVHKSTLSMWSPVFEAMFTHQFKESTVKEIPLREKRANEVKELLKVIYSSWSKPNITDENCHFLLQLADEYQMDGVKKLCSEFLVDKIEASNCLELFKLAEKFSLDDVKERCNKEVCYKSSADLEGSEHFNGFEPDLKVDICMKVIKELERTMEEYVKTCSDLVKEVYKKVSMKFNCGMLGESRSLKDHIKKHKSQKTKLKDSLATAPLKTCKLPSTYDYAVEYEFSCIHCSEEIQHTKWKHNEDYSILQEHLKRLHVLIKKNSTVLD